MSGMPAWGHCRHNGPATWGRHWPVVDNPKLGQSPIDIKTGDVRDPVSPWKPLEMTYPEVGWFLHNNGHFFQMDVRPGHGDNALRGGPLTEDYQLAQFHFHWSPDDQAGSEHMVDGQSYAAEAHILHYDAKRYSSWKEAVLHKNGLAIFAVFFKIGEANVHLQKLIDRFDDISYSGDRVDWTDGFKVQWLLPTDVDKYCYYYGALTGPPLGESVNWIVFQQPLQLSRQQLATFRRLHTHARGCETTDEYNGLMMCNIKSPQPKDFDTIDSDGTVRRVVRHVYEQKRELETEETDDKKAQN